MALRRIYLLLLFIGIIRAQDFSQELILTGSIIDSLSNQSIPDVSVIIEGTTLGTVTDRDGHFSLAVSKNYRHSFLLIQHVTYYSQRIAVRDWHPDTVIRLKIKKIELPEVQVEASRRPYKYEQELTNIVAEIPADKFESRGFVDAADILIGEQSVLIDEGVSGRKTISVRGSNSEEVIVLFDGIRINNNYNNQFDLSTIDQSTLQQIDIIKGGNSVVAGAYGSSAVINFIPKLEQDYLIKFQQRFGSYDSGDWGLSLYKDLSGLKFFSSFHTGASNQQYIDEPDQLAITHSTSNYLINVQRPCGPNTAGDFKHLFRIRLLGSRRDYDNLRYFENLSIANLTGNLAYAVYLFPTCRTNLSFTLQKNNESLLNTSYLNQNENERTTRDESYAFTFDQSIRIKNIDLFLSYNRTFSDLTYRELYLESDGVVAGKIPADFERRQSYFSTSFQFPNTIQRQTFGWDKINFNLTLEQTQDLLQPVSFNWRDTVAVDQNWAEADYQITLSFTDKTEQPRWRINLATGISHNIPTPYQQVSHLRYKPFDDERILLRPEYKKNLEADLTYTRVFPEKRFEYDISAAFFRHLYVDKFREVRISNSPIIVFDNFSESDIYGFELKGRTSFLARRIDLQTSFVRYYPSDKIAFPFKSDRKVTAGLTGNYRGFNLDIFWFSESERTGWIKKRNGDTYLAKLPAYANLDLHLIQTVKFHSCTGSVSFSVRNLIDRELALDGISIYDRRFYLNFGIEF